MLFHIVSAIQWLSFLIGLFYFQRISHQAVRWLILYLGCVCGIELILGQIDDVNKQTIATRIYYSVSFPVGYLLYSALFRQQLSVLKGSQYWLIGTAFFLFLFSTYSLLFNLEKKSEATDVFTVTAILSLGVCLLYFRSLLQSKENINLVSEPLFWIATALLFYYAGNIVATGFFHTFYKKSSYFATNLFKINLILSILQSILFSIAFVIAARKPQHG